MTGTTRAYRQQRARAMAYGTWAPWADPEPVREHVRQLRAAGASYAAIGRAAGMATMAVHALVNGGGQVKAETADALMGVTPERLDLARVPAAGTARRIRALVAIGHSYSRISRALGCHFETVQRLARGDVSTVAPGLQADAERLYAAWWDKAPQSAPGRSGWPRRRPGGERSGPAGRPGPGSMTSGSRSGVMSRRRSGAGPLVPALHRRTRSAGSRLSRLCSSRDGAGRPGRSHRS